MGTGPLGRPSAETSAQPVPEEDAYATLRAVFASPINFIDTAALYGGGQTERWIGRVIRELGGLPQSAVLQTKSGRDPRTGDFTGEGIKWQLERSLESLGLDHIQVAYLHDPEHTTFDAAMAPGGPVESLLRYKDQGIIGHLGVSGGPLDLLIQYVKTGLFETVITHNRYTLLDQTADPFLTAAAELGLAVLNAAPYGGGILAMGPDAYPYYRYQEASPELLMRAKAIEGVCRRHGVVMAAAALQFSLCDPRITSTLVGMTCPEQVAQTLRLAVDPIPDSFWAEVASLQRG